MVFCCCFFSIHNENGQQYLINQKKNKRKSEVKTNLSYFKVSLNIVICVNINLQFTRLFDLNCTVKLAAYKYSVILEVQQLCYD